MAVRLTSKNCSIVLKQGSYSYCELSDLGLIEEVITKIKIRSGSSVIISQQKGVVFEATNESDRAVCYVTAITIDRCTKIDVGKICMQETPCDACDEEWDYIIVGLGSAGSILARKLSDDLQTRVLVIEAGRSHQADPVTLDPNWIPIASTLLYNPKYATSYPVPSSSPTNPFGAYTYSEGYGWGGSSAHNFLVAVRGTPTLYDSWAADSGNPAWSYNNMLPIMKAVEHFYPNPPGSGSLTQRGYQGPISITQSPPLNHTPLLDAMSATFNAPYVSDYNNPDLGNVGTAANQEFKTPGPDSHRSYSNLEYLPIGIIVDKYGNGLHGRKLKIVSNARVLHFETTKPSQMNPGGKLRATSVKYVYTGQEAVVQEAHLSCNGKLILSAGGIMTPRILLTSGIGPASELLALGIQPKVDSPQVGKNLQDQYGSAAVITGAADNLSQVYTSLVTPDDQVRRLQLINVGVAPGLVQVLPAILNSKSRGSVTIADPNPLVYPKLEIGVYTDGDETVPGSDLNLAVTFYKQIKVAAESAGGAVIVPPAFAYANDASLAAWAKTDANVTLQSHITGTCRMGTDISSAVVDGELSVFGLSNVRVGDISIEPLSTDGNTCFGAYYIGLKLCEFLGVPTPPAL